MSYGHGHVVPRPDGVRMRCGGPRLCTVCQREEAEFGASALRASAEALVEFIRVQHPSDFQPGCRGYICPHHIAIAKALGRDDMPPPAPEKLCDKCHHPVDDHEYSWSGPWDWWECRCGCRLGDN